jgi:hypothetical protein
MDLDTRFLTVRNYGDTEEEITEVTIGPDNVQMVIANTKDMVKFGLRLKKVNVLFMDGGNAELHISAMDLIDLQRAVGNYILP